MPELPEVETIRRGLVPVFVGKRLDSLEISDARWCDPQPPALLADALVGRTIGDLSRRGKYLV
ncbi:MAG TPA: DNA-formamidopyrimidine glycosylase family protein, partial [Baekduia sp.]|nr:DNA-formamidopyrimidine glycosylase family protein [Baekduia sp.]